MRERLDNNFWKYEKRVLLALLDQSGLFLFQFWAFSKRATFSLAAFVITNYSWCPGILRDVDIFKEFHT